MRSISACAALAYGLAPFASAWADDPTPNPPPTIPSPAVAAATVEDNDQNEPLQGGGEVIEVTGTAAPITTNMLVGNEPLAASDTVVDQPQLALRPHNRAEDLTQEVPGLFTVQHAGGGKAQQYFMRGFDLDHGTDLAGFVDGVPINAVSHAHGQGYLDLHFLIPETIESIEATKGPYSPLVGDFAVAGSMGFHVADHVEQNIAQAELGPDGHRRALVIDSPDLGPDWKMLAAVEAFDENGPFIHPDDYNRMNSVVKATRQLGGGSTLTLEGMAYSGTWNMSGVLPARAVCGENDGTPVPAEYAGNRCINRFDSIDPSQGGASQRYMIESTFRKPIARGDVEASVYSLHSNLQLFPNDGIAAPFQPEGIRYGSQVEQDDTRFEQGVNVRVHQDYDVPLAPLHSTFGVQLRNDVVASQLHRTEDRMRLDGLPGIGGPIEDSGIDETESGAYAQEDWRPIKWLRAMAGARLDRIDADVNNEAATAIYKPSGYRGAEQLSPKAALVVTPVPQVDLFANFGQGFHTNDVRTVIVGSDTTLIARATGYELGTTVHPVSGLDVSVLGFLLDLTSEETIDGDTASTDPSGPTRRYGTEISARYHFDHSIYAEGTYTYAHSRYTDAQDIADGTTYVELAPKHTLSAEVGAIEKLAPDLVVYSSLNVRAMSDRYAESDGSLIATGFTVFNGELGVRFDRYELGATVINIGNEVYREGQFAVQSRLPGEGPNPPEGISFTPGLPRRFLVHAAIRWN